MPRPKRRDTRAIRRLRERVRREEPICWICGRPIDPHLRAPHPWSFSVDHLRPVSTHPELELDRSNCRAAHRLHNQQRGTGRQVVAARRSRDW
ncbi:MAG: HNH endonuclease [Actinobacteria bacterium]|nr:HNH endonuclease [Actinomycetota bacterium]